MTIALIERLSFAFTANVRLNLRNFQNERLSFAFTANVRLNLRNFQNER